MKKSFTLLVIITSVCGSAYAQFNRETMSQKREVKKIVIQSPPPVSTPPAPATPTAPPPAPAASPIYSLSGVIVKVRTGNDNKENMSNVGLALFNQNTNILCFKPASPINVQFDSNSEMEFRLIKFSMQGMPDNAPSLLLSSLQAKGMRFQISYTPNFLFDAWKVQGATLILEFKDQFGQAHPTLNNTVVNLSNAVGFLDSRLRTITCLIDKDFRPLSANISD